MRYPFSPNFHVDSEFIHQAQVLLDYLRFEEAGVAGNSPVLGLPLELYRLILDIIAYFGSATRDALSLIRLQDQVKHWEQALNIAEDCDNDALLPENPHTEVIALYTLTTSLLLDLMHFHKPQVEGKALGSVWESGGHHWQASRVLAMFAGCTNYSRWTHCYIMLWPILIVGYAVQDAGDISLVTKVLGDMRKSMGYGEVQRVHDELDRFWSTRQSFQPGITNAIEYAGDLSRTGCLGVPEHLDWSFRGT